jgi:ring-1,2-phenylacetyl-CoA epoxidase subunit PaaD
MVTAVRLAADRPAVDEAAVRSALADVADPEIPAISIVDLGIVDRIAVDDGRIAVDLLPTFLGCPALDAIRAAVEGQLSRFGRPVDVAFVSRVPWTSDRITVIGRERLRASGFAPPTEPADVHCPWCDSARIVMDSAFGPTLCRSLFYCRDCRQPFEAFKPI